MSVRIKIKNAVKRYGNSTIIPDLSLEIKEGEFFTLLGPSGCGKTTLLRISTVTSSSASLTAVRGRRRA
jgi:iron(III) transport system ATP-binding protein